MYLELPAAEIDRKVRQQNAQLAAITERLSGLARETGRGRSRVVVKKMLSKVEIRENHQLTAGFHISANVSRYRTTFTSFT